MRPSNDDPGQITSAQPQIAVPVHGEIVTSDAPETLVTAHASPLVAQPAELTGMLLPTEGVTFASTPHPVIFVRPAVSFIVVAIALAVALAWETHPVVRGHHRAVPLLTGYARTAVEIAGALLLLQQVVALLARAFHFLAYRVVTTNRRVFVVTGLFGRHVTPLGNTALAGATMSQGPLGRILGYGDVVLGGGGPAIREMRDPVRLYREFEAVANGVEGDTWKMAIRQTQIP
ncbi:MAG TPA: PH domain-containing protein [Candidatus Elarobacter sp.]|jgi:hypothetical protein|nr:PH domain-containing protein [Candidatus Elarobacter sp.]